MRTHLVERLLSLHPYVKAAWVSSFIVAFFTKDVWLSAIMAAVAVLSFLVSRAYRSVYGRGLYILIAVVALVGVLYVLQQPTEPYGIEFLLVILGWIALSFSAVTFFVITRPYELTFILNKMRVPDGVATALAAGFRFVPIVFEEVQKTFMAQRARGLPSLTLRNVRHLPFILSSLTIPLFVSVAERTENMHYALSIRGKGSSPESGQKLSLIDVVVMLYVLGLLITLLFEKVG